MTTHLYARVSTTEQASDNKSSLADQEQRTRGCAMIRGVTDPVLHVDAGVSGSIPLAKRPAGGAMYRSLKPGDVVIASKVDRAFRDALDAMHTAAEFQKRGIGLILADLGSDPVTDNGMSKLFFSFMAAMAEWERTRIAERSADGRKSKKKRGGHIGGSPPYGYKVTGRGPTAVLEPDPAEQHVLEIVKFNASNGATVRDIAAGLEQNGFKSRSGQPFFYQQVHRMLQNNPLDAPALPV